MQQVLFVDDDPDVLAGLRRRLFPLRKKFGGLFARSGEAALECLSTESVGVIVSDRRMPGMDGRDLLAEVRRRRPDAIRMVLLGQSDPQKTAAAVQTAHQHLARTCEPAVLRAPGLRGLPGEVVQAVAWHHGPWRAPGRQLTAQPVVHVADALVMQRSGPNQSLAEPDLDTHYLAELGLDRLPREWLAEADATLGPGGQA